MLRPIQLTSETFEEQALLQLSERSVRATDLEGGRHRLFHTLPASREMNTYRTAHFRSPTQVPKAISDLYLIVTHARVRRLSVCA